MSWTRPSRFVPGQFLRQCDLCGLRFLSGRLWRGEDGFWRCDRTCREVPAITRDKISAQSQHRQEAPPPPWGLPYDQKDSYSEEAQAFNFLVSMPVRDPNWPGGLRLGAAPSDGFNVTTGAPSAMTATTYSYPATYETCRYLYGLIVENARPASWIALARAKLRELADFLLTKQTLSGTPDTNMVYGGFDQAALAGGNPVYTLFDQAGCGLALLWAYRTLGDFKYIAGARACANTVRTFQWSDQVSNFFTSSDAAGTARLHVGGFTSQLSFSGTFGGLLYSSSFTPNGLQAVEFLSLLKSTDGDATYGGLGVTGPQSFVTSSAATLTAMIADALNFYTNGVFDALSGTTYTGLSATTPRNSFNAFPANKGGAGFFPPGTGAWEYSNGNAIFGTQISGIQFPLALRSLYAVSGYNTQVASVWTWLMSFTSNPAFVGPAGSIAIDAPIASTMLSVNPPTPPTGQGNIIAPSYQPKLCVAATLTVRDASLAPTAINSIALYDWEHVGLLAAIQGARDPGALRKAKEALIAGRTRFLPTLSGASVIQETLLMAGLSGLAFQTGSAQGPSYRWTASSVARAAMVFRYGTTAFVSAGRPDRTQGGAQPGTMQVQ